MKKNIEPVDISGWEKLLQTTGWTKYEGSDSGMPPINVDLDVIQMVSACSRMESADEIAPPALVTSKVNGVIYWRMKSE